MSVEISVIAECDIPDGVERWLEVPLALLSERTGDFSCSILLTTEEAIRDLNRDYRSCDRVTDVLSFPSRAAGEAPEPDGFAGDIAVCVARAGEQAGALGHSLERELAFLVLHGALHLHGWDHETEPEAEEMFALQREIMRKTEQCLDADDA